MSSREPMPAGVEEILRLFSGRRRSPRTALRRIIDVQGASRAFRGSTLDVSQLGALIEIDDEGFLPTGAVASLMDVAEIVRGIFPGTMTLRFRRANVFTRARVVRVAQHPSRLDAVLGCEFETPLSPADCRAIGVTVDTRGDVATVPASEPASDVVPARPRFLRRR